MPAGATHPLPIVRAPPGRDARLAGGRLLGPDLGTSFEQQLDAPSRRDDAFMRGAAWVFVGLMVLRLVLTDNVLNQFFQYSAEGGFILIKIHPATYGMLILLMVMLVRLKFFLTVQETRLILPLFWMIGVIILLVGFMLGLGRSVAIGYLLETYIAASLIAFMLFLFPLEQRRMIGNTILIYIVVNAVVAIIEKVLGTRFLPYPYVEATFRPTALTTHPLAIGLIHAGAVVFVLATRWPGWVKAASMALIVMGTFAAGARTGAIFTSVACLAAAAISPMPGRNADSRARSAAILFGAIALLGPLLLVIAGSAGFLERFQGGYIDENAQARIDVYKVFEWVSWREILFGSDIVAIKKMVMDRLDILVESSVVVFVFQFGLFGAILFGASLLYMMLRLAIGTDRRALIGVGAFFAVVMSNDALSGKHCYILMMLLLLIAFRNDVPDAFGRYRRRTWEEA